MTGRSSPCASAHRSGAALLVATVATTFPLAAGCADDPDPVTARRVGESIVGVRTTGCGLAAQVGSGVVVDDDGTIVTVAHTVAGSETIEVVDADERTRPARLVAFDPDLDLAALHVDAAPGPPLPLAPRVDGSVLGDASLGSWSRVDGIRVVDAEVTRRLAITIEDIYVEDVVERSGVEIGADVVVGDSGGAVVGADGEVVGIVYARSRQRPGVAFAVDADEVRRVLATVETTADGSRPVEIGSGDCP